MIQLRRWIFIVLSALSVCAVIGSAVWQKYYYASASAESIQNISPVE